MKYKKKAAVLSALVAILGLVYILTFVTDAERRRSPSFAWLDGSLLDHADRIEIYGVWGLTALARKNGVWVYPVYSMDYPVKQARVEALLSALSARLPYTPRGISSEGEERLGLSDRFASRIIIRGGAGLPLLELLVGDGDALGREVYLKKAGRKEIYSGEDRFTLYVDSRPDSWYELRLFPAASGVYSGGSIHGSARMISSSGTGIAAAMVQQVDVNFPGRQINYSLVRSGGSWELKGNTIQYFDLSRADNWLDAILNTEAIDFSEEAPGHFVGSVTLHPGDGTSRTIYFCPVDGEETEWYAMQDDSPLVYILPKRAINRILGE